MGSHLSKVTRSLSTDIPKLPSSSAISRSRRHIIVGDPHGCADELRQLLKEVDFTDGVDELVLVGDLVAKGPKSQEVIDIAIEKKAVSVRGNHGKLFFVFHPFHSFSSLI